MAALVTHVVGARPNFVKAAPVIHALKSYDVRQRLIHTGQHYDASLSNVFFRDLKLPEPDVNLGVGSGTQADQTARLLVTLEEALLAEPPALVVTYGDVNSTLAAALVASKLVLPLAHVEAGLRSFDRTMPEETNRRVADILSDLLFVTAPEGMENLAREGIDAGVHFVGNPMIDTLLASLDRLQPEPVRAAVGVRDHDDYALVTLHRPTNVDTEAAARRVTGALQGLSELIPVVLPLHPRGRATLEGAGLRRTDRILVCEPLGYLDFLALMRDARLVVTDSGGIQEETTVLGVPCLTLRPNTERPVTIAMGTNRLVEPDDLVGVASELLRDGAGPQPRRPPLWDGQAGERIAAIIARHVGAGRRA